MHKRIEIILKKEFEPQILEVVDDSAKHAGHAEVRGATGATHFSVLIVADCFTGKTLVERHRMIYESLKEELKSSIHALAIKAYTPQEHTAQGHKL